jgi:serine/threonine protein kinase
MNARGSHTSAMQQRSRLHGPSRLKSCRMRRGCLSLTHGVAWPTGNAATKVSFYDASPSSEMSTVTDLVGYVLEPLRLGSEYILYRGRPADSAAPILVLAPAAAQQSPANLRRLEHEYAIASELDPEWAVRPSALARRDGRTMLVFEDPGGEPLDRLPGDPPEIAKFLRIAIALVGALRRVHERVLIHKDIKPANILFDRTCGGVWLTGLGIASRLPRERQHPEPPEETGPISGGCRSTR